MAELFIELRSEEIPARMQQQAADNLERLLVERLSAIGLKPESSLASVTPRRLAVVLEGVPAAQADRTEEKRGPKVGAPEQALAGFLKGAGLASIDEAEQRETPKGTFWFAVKEISGEATIDVLPGLIADVITSLPWPKSMRWGRSSLRYVRPLQSVIALFDGQIVDGRVEAGNGEAIAFGNTTIGHRFMGPTPFKVSDYSNYASKLHDQKVMLDQHKRRDEIAAGLADEAAKHGLTMIADNGLLHEVAGLVEWPVPMIGRIDNRFMSLPREVLTTSMREHQKFFAFEKDGELAPYFGTVANIIPQDGGGAIIAGNERVLRARLADAEFFWDQDRKTPLGDNVPKLSSIVFHAKLGTVGDKIDRMGPLAVAIADRIGADKDAVRSAVRLAKADLVTGMVGEFPELQGLMGRYYAQLDGESADVALAIEQHYQPQGPSDSCPSAPVSVAVALADKLDTLAGFWAIEELPTGSKDPFGLRRAALGVIRLVVENGLSFDLNQFVALAFQQHGCIDDDILHSLNVFIAERLRIDFRSDGINADIVSAVCIGQDLSARLTDLPRLYRRALALRDFRDSDSGRDVIAAYRRAGNILAAEKKKGALPEAFAIDPAAFAEPAETALSEALTALDAALTPELEADDFTTSLAAIGAVRGPLDTFFDGVMVNADDPAQRLNRLSLLHSFGELARRVADFGLIES